jgi:hypothetical protein
MNIHFGQHLTPGTSAFWNLTNQEVKKALEDVLNYQSEFEKYILPADAIDGDIAVYSYPGFGAPPRDFSPDGLTYKEFKGLRPNPIFQEKFKLHHKVFYDTDAPDVLKDAIGSDNVVKAQAAALRNLGVNLTLYRDQLLVHQMLRIGDGSKYFNDSGDVKEDSEEMKHSYDPTKTSCIYRKCQIVFINNETLEDQAKLSTALSSLINRCSKGNRVVIDAKRNYRDDQKKKGTTSDIWEYDQVDTRNTIAIGTSFAPYNEIVLFADNHLEVLIEIYLKNKLLGYSTLVSKLLAVEGVDFGLLNDEGEPRDFALAALAMSHKAIKSNFSISKIVSAPMEIDTLKVNRASHIKLHVDLSRRYPITAMIYRKKATV